MVGGCDWWWRLKRGCMIGRLGEAEEKEGKGGWRGRGRGEGRERGKRGRKERKREHIFKYKKNYS